MLPTAIIAGDTTEFTWQDAAYPSDAWTLKAYLVGPTVVAIDGVASGDGFTVTIPATRTATLAAGLYDLTIRVSQGTTVTTVDSGLVDIRPNPALSPSKVVIAQRMITLIEKALTGQLEDGEAFEALSISGRSLTNINRLELLEERGFWLRELRGLKNGRNGMSGIRSIALNVGRL